MFSGDSEAERSVSQTGQQALLPLNKRDVSRYIDLFPQIPRFVLFSRKSEDFHDDELTIQVLAKLVRSPSAKHWPSMSWNCPRIKSSSSKPTARVVGDEYQTQSHAAHDLG